VGRGRSITTGRSPARYPSDWGLNPKVFQGTLESLVTKSPLSANRLPVVWNLPPKGPRAVAQHYGVVQARASPITKGRAAASTLVVEAGHLL
jgi:hypothetical protein